MSKTSRYLPETVIAIRGDRSQSILQQGSKRKALIRFMLEVGGRCTVQEMTAHFGCDLKQVLANLEASGWISLEAPGTGLPRRTSTLKANIDMNPEYNSDDDIATVAG